MKTRGRKIQIHLKKRGGCCLKFYNEKWILLISNSFVIIFSLTKLINSQFHCTNDRLSTNRSSYLANDDELLMAN